MDGRAKTSGEITSNSVISPTMCYLVSVVVLTDGTNAGLVDLYDSPSGATGTKLASCHIDGAEDRSRQFSWDPPLWCQNGVYLTISGTGAKAFVYTK